MRLGAALLLGLLAAVYLALGVRLYFFPSGSAVASGLVGVAFGVGALVYGVLTRAVVRHSRPGHIVAAVVAALGAVLSVSGSMQWPDWVTLAVNVAAFVLLLGSVPARTRAAA